MPTPPAFAAPAEFSDAVLALLVRRQRAPSVSRRLLSSVAQLARAAATVTASTLHSTAAPGGDAVARLVSRVGEEAADWLAGAPRGPAAAAAQGPGTEDESELVVSGVLRVTSAVLAAASPYLRALISAAGELSPQLCAVAPALAPIAARHRGRKLLALVINEGHLDAAQAVLRFAYTADVRLSGSRSAFDALLVAEQLQARSAVAACVCGHVCWARRMWQHRQTG